MIYIHIEMLIIWAFCVFLKTLLEIDKLVFKLYFKIEIFSSCTLLR